jgi:dynein heavy chain
LDRLTNAKGNLLENIELIENLEESKRLSVEISEKVAIAKITEKEITDASEMYRASAIRGALIFFLMNELYKMSSFYMYSLESYVNIINIAIDSTKLDTQEAAPIDATNPSEVKKADTALGDSTVKATPRLDKQDTDKKTLENESSVLKEKSATKNESSADNLEGQDMEASDVKVDEPVPDKDIIKEELENVKILTPRSLKKRVKDITDSITYTAFQSVRRGLFEDHKLIFATLLTFRILIEQKVLTQTEVDHLIVSK